LSSGTSEHQKIRHAAVWVIAVRSRNLALR